MGLAMFPSNKVTQRIAQIPSNNLDQPPTVRCPGYFSHGGPVETTRRAAATARVGEGMWRRGTEMHAVRPLLGYLSPASSSRSPPHSCRSCEKCAVAAPPWEVPINDSAQCCSALDVQLPSARGAFVPLSIKSGQDLDSSSLTISSTFDSLLKAPPSDTSTVIMGRTKGTAQQL